MIGAARPIVEIAIERHARHISKRDAGASPVMLILSFYFLPFLMRLPWQYAAAFMASGLIYVGGALGMEFVGGYFITTYGETSFQYVLAFLIEESLEMIGLTCFLAALFCYLKNQLSGYALNLTLGP